MITGADGNEIPRDPANIRIRLIRTFKAPGQTMADISAEVKALSPEDLAWYARAFTEAGYPTTVDVK